MTKKNLYIGLVGLGLVLALAGFIYFKGNAVLFAITQTDKVEAEQARFEQYLENYGKTQGLD